MAKIKITTSHDLELIANAAGSVDPMSRSCTGEYFEISDVTQESLEAALNECDHTELSRCVHHSKAEIDNVAEVCRMKYITSGVGQASVYLEKAEEAADFVAAKYPQNLDNYPFIQAESSAAHVTPKAAADNIISQKTMWITKSSQIENHRTRAKHLMDRVSNVKTLSRVIKIFKHKLNKV